MNPTNNTWTINYKLTYEDGSDQVFPIVMDAKTLEILQPKPVDYPDWTKRACHKCSNCPFDWDDRVYCTIAVKILDIVDHFCQPQPSKNVDVAIETPERTYHKNVNVKTAASSLLGIYMAAGGCPVLDKLRPMVRFHLPFATSIETTYRAIANYLIAQYLLATDGREADWELKGLRPMYEEIETVNMHFRERLQEVSAESYALTALLQLDSFASFITMSLSDDAVMNVEQLFNREFENNDLLDPENVPDVSNDKLTITYQFHLGNNVKEFAINLDRQTMRLLPDKTRTPSAWTELSCSKCPNCPLDDTKFEHCPAAVGVAETIEFFKDVQSIEETTVTVKTAERDYSAQTMATVGITAMMGLIMATSGCPIVGRLKPLAYHHLPFSSNKETIYRALGMYLLSQYFVAKAGEEPDWKLANFAKLYDEINVVNKAFCTRLREATVEDANLNALIKLDCFAQQISFIIEESAVSDLKELYRAYFE